jgi:hypothetical protein
MISFKQFFFEKTVSGVVEEIYIEDIGTVSAKIDSGNSAYNVLHGIQISTDNKTELKFKTINDIVITKPITGYISINVGAGHTEDRPVIELDVKINDKTFNNVKFSISDRSSNENPVLIGKDFIMNQLDALIDVSGKNLLAKNIDVRY